MRADEQTFKTAGIPAIIVEAGEEAIRVYRAYLEDPGRSPYTERTYRLSCRRFFDWAAERCLTLHGIAPEHVKAYREEIMARGSSHLATIYLTPVRGVFRALVAAGVLAASPFDKVSPPQAPHAKSPTDDFPLLQLMAMLANMEPSSLEIVLRDASTAEKLLAFVRWRDGRICTRCGTSDEESDSTIAGSVHQYRCNACGNAYSVTDGTPFDGTALALKDGLFLMHATYCAGDAPPREVEELAGERQIDAELARSLVAAIERALAGMGLEESEAQRQALQRVDREMQQDEVARGIIEYAELDACRAALLRAKDEGTDVDDLPPGMTLDEAIDEVNARIAEHDRYLIWMEDGYLVRRLPEAFDEETLATTDAAPG
jgi:transposase-like protein